MIRSFKDNQNGEVVYSVDFLGYYDLSEVEEHFHEIVTVWEQRRKDFLDEFFGDISNFLTERMLSSPGEVNIEGFLEANKSSNELFKTISEVVNGIFKDVNKLTKRELFLFNKVLFSEYDVFEGEVYSVNIISVSPHVEFFSAVGYVMSEGSLFHFWKKTKGCL